MGRSLARDWRTLFAIAVLGITAIGCGRQSIDLVSSLPKQIAGNTLSYNRVAGPELRAQFPEAWQLAVGQAVGAPVESITTYSGYLDPRIGYNSDIVRVEGASAPQLLEATISALGFGGERRVDTIAGKAVTRATPPEAPTSALDSAPYFYAAGDTVIVIVSANPSFAVEAFQTLPIADSDAP